MKDLFVLIILVIFIIIAHSWTNPEKKQSVKEKQKPATVTISANTPSAANSGAINPGISIVFRSDAGGYTVPKQESQFSNDSENSNSSFLCPIHRAHNRELSLFCAYYPFPLGSEYKVRQAGFLLKH